MTLNLPLILTFLGVENFQACLVVKAIQVVESQMVLMALVLV